MPQVIDRLSSNQYFEIVYELCWKFIQRWLRINGTPDEAEHLLTRKDLFRLAARYGLIDDPQPWFEFGDARNLTSHTYNAAEADAVLAQATPLAHAARSLLDQLQARNA